MSQEPEQTAARGHASLEPVEQFLTELLERIAPGTTFSLKQEGKNLFVNLSGATAFVQREGASIQALEHLIDLYLRRHLREEMRVKADMDDFRRRRTEGLQNLAVTLAQQVVEENKAVDVEPMTAWERKTIHEALEGVAQVSTFSRGSVERHVVIAPKRAKRRPAVSRKKSPRPKSD